MAKPLPPRPQRPLNAACVPRTLRETYAEALRLAELMYRSAQEVLEAGDDSDEARARYARELHDYDRLQAMFPFVAAGLGDVEQ